MTARTPLKSRPTTDAANPAPESNWRVYGLCREVDPDLFHPSGNGGQVVEQVKNAKTVCSRCVVRVECLQWALDTGEPNGVCGGLTRRERIALGPPGALRRCRDNVDLIAQRRVEGVPWHQIALELKVRGAVVRQVAREAGIVTLHPQRSAAPEGVAA